MPDTSGRTSLRQFAFYDPDGSCWRTWPAISLWGSETYSGTWPKRGSMRSGACFEHPTWEPPTSVPACSSLLPTPMTADGEGGRRATNLEWVDGTAYRPSGSKASVSLRESLDLLPTPTAAQPGGTAEQHLARKQRMPDGANRTSITDLRMAIEHYLPTPTPTASDAKGPSPNHQGTTAEAIRNLSRGDATNPPSPDGNTPSDDPHPLLPMTEDD